MDPVTLRFECLKLAVQATQNHSPEQLKTAIPYLVKLYESAVLGDDDPAAPPARTTA